MWGRADTSTIVRDEKGQTGKCIFSRGLLPFMPHVGDARRIGKSRPYIFHYTFFPSQRQSGHPAPLFWQDKLGLSRDRTSSNLSNKFCSLFFVGRGFERGLHESLDAGDCRLSHKEFGDSIYTYYRDHRVHFHLLLWRPKTNIQKEWRDEYRVLFFSNRIPPVKLFSTFYWSPGKNSHFLIFTKMYDP